MKNELEGKDCAHLIKDGWILTKIEKDQMNKWVLENKKYNYRIFHYSNEYEIDLAKSKMNELVIRKGAVESMREKVSKCDRIVKDCLEEKNKD